MTNFLGSDLDDTITPDLRSVLVVSWPELFVLPGAGDDVIEGGGGNDTLDGGGGNDEVSGGSGNDLLYGSDGNDSLRAGGGNDLGYGGSGNDTLDSSGSGTSDSPTLFGGIGEDVFYGGGAFDVFYGGQGRDTINGGDNADVLFGDEGNDRLYGGTGRDSLVGGIDNDYMVGGFGIDTLNGGDGNDTLNGVEESAPRPDGLDNLFGGNNDDLFVVNYFVISISPAGLSADNIYGGEGTDTLDISKPFTGYDCVFDLGTGVLSVIYEPTFLMISNAQAFLSIESVIAGDGDDTIYGTDGYNFIRGGNGSDIIFGGGGGDGILGDGGDDEIHALIGDIAYGGGGIDSLIIEPATGDVILNLATSVDLEGFEAVSTGAGNDSLTGSGQSMEWLYGGDGNDAIDGAGGTNVVVGGNGNDLLYSTGIRDDSLYGDAGNDQINLNARTSLIGMTIDGGADTDTVDLAEATVTLDTVARFVDIENIDVFQTVIAGTTGADNLDFEDFATSAFGAPLGMTINGGGGNDRIAGSNVRSADDVLNGDAGLDTVIGNKGRDWIRGGDDNDVAAGGKGEDSLFGDGGDDVLVGGKGGDALHGGLGSDRFYFLSAKDSGGREGDSIFATAQAAAFEGAGAAVGDLIDLSQIDADTTLAGRQAFVVGGTGIGQLQIVNDGNNTVILGNTDDDAKIEFRLTIWDGAILASAYTAEDFVL